jgi:hypothetical protein
MDSAAREALRQAIGHEHLLFQEAQRADAEAERWQRRSRLAVRQGEEQLAQQAIERQRAAEHRARRYREQYAAQTEAVRRAKDAVFAAPPLAATSDAAARLDALAREDRLDRDLAALKARLSG